MTTILGIDAAWTAHEPSGVALVRFDGGSWRCVAVAPCYASFIALAGGLPVDLVDLAQRLAHRMSLLCSMCRVGFLARR